MDATSVASPASMVFFRDSPTSPSSSQHRPARSTVLRSPRGLLGGGDILGGISTIITDVTSAVDGDVATVLNALGGKHPPTSSSSPLGPSPQPPLSSPTGSPGTTASGSPPQPPTYYPTDQPPPAPSNSASQPSQNPNPSPQSTPSSPRPTATAETSTASSTASLSESGPSHTPTSSVVSNYADTALSLISTPNGLWLGSTGASATALLAPTEVSNPTHTPSGHIQEPSATDTPSPESPTGHAPYTPPNGAHPQGLSTETIVGIALGALVFVVLCVALCLFLLLRRRAWGRSRRMSVESARRRLKPYSYADDDDDDDSSRRVSSVWTGFGSVSVDPHFDLESVADSLDFQFAEKPDANSSSASAAAYTPRGPSPSPSPSPYPSPSPAPAPTETQPLAPGVSLSSVRHSLHHPPPISLPAAASSSSSADLLALAETEYAVANPFLDGSGSDGGLGRSASRVSRATAALGDVLSVEAL